MEKRAQKIQCEICKNLIHNSVYDQHIAECFYRQQQESGNLQNLINQSQQYLQQQQQSQQFSMEDTTQCPNCGQKIKFSELHLHENQCQNKDSKCEYCAEVFPQDLMSEHLEFCQEKKNFTSQFGNQQQNQRQQQYQQSQNHNNENQHLYNDGNGNGMNIFDFIFNQADSRQLQRQRQLQQIQQQQQQNRIQHQAQLNAINQNLRQQQQQQQQQNQQRQQQQRPQQNEMSLPDLFQLLIGGDRGSRNQDGFIIRRSNSNRSQRMSQEQSPAIIMLRHLFQNGTLENFDYSNNGGVSQETLKEFPVFKFQKKEGQDEDQSKCPVCMCEFEDQEEVKMLDCTHKYHIECIDKWLEKNSTCPVCKTDMKN